ncbi:glycoside hydrolase family protein [Venturia nashicola]|uniref:Glycoside hydrolase family 92 protein n=1 Tax=Venturia nashicola TaxID=86259 RepID=A0A4Z1NTB9_9PEZI|nr:glycoside hydrolase family 92 protein [Venturia nashicola]TLD27469.1 glycoside hydrolase family protein [Venturia nashicola]
MHIKRSLFSLSILASLGVVEAAINETSDASNTTETSETTTPVANNSSDLPLFDPLQYVDPLIGSAKDGHVFAGASLPYGLAKAVADVDGDNNQGGFVSEDPRLNITGFSALHDSGTGGSPSLGNFALFPITSCPGNDINNCRYPKKERKVKYVTSSVVATPGYFAITLVNKIAVEMTTARRTALFNFRFPKGETGNPMLMLDLTDLSDSRQDNGTIHVDPKTGRMKGSGVFKPSFAGGEYKAYFCVDFKGAKIHDSGIFANSRASNLVHDLTISRSINGYPLPGGGMVRFEPPAKESDPITARVAISFISADQACQSAESEIPDWNFDRVKRDAEAAWRKKLSPIVVSTGGGVNLSLLTNMYSGIYRTMMNPQDYTGENPEWKSNEPYFDSFYCLWDSFRSQIPFLVLFDPVEAARMIRSLIDTYKHEGWLPDCRMTFSKGYTQGGSNADTVLADAYVKGLKENIDWNEGYNAVVKDATVEPFDWCCQGRGGIDSWNALGYIPVQDFDYKGFGTVTRSISRTLEYSYNDFCISEMAAGLGGRQSDVEKYTRSSRNWLNLFNPATPSFRETKNSTTDTGFVGFFQPKYLNRTWGFQDPLGCSQIDEKGVYSCSLQNTGAETYESSVWEYSFFVPHDQAALITALGGPASFIRRLEYIHDQNITVIGNEPCFLTVFQYHYGGRPALSAKRAHYYVPREFNPTSAGLPGNDDSGAMGSFLAFTMMGLSPNPGQNVYFIIPPFFESVSFKSPLTGKTAIIKNVNFDPKYEAIYIQSATLNGKPYTKNWIGHEFFLKGGELVLTLGKTESSWGTHVEDLPPSLSAYVGFNSSSKGNPGRKRAVRYDTDLEMGAGARQAGLDTIGFS